MKMKIFSVKSGNRKPEFATLEVDVNAWLAEYPDVVIEHTSDLSHPSAAWSHLTLVVWYREN